MWRSENQQMGSIEQRRETVSEDVMRRSSAYAYSKKGYVLCSKRTEKD